MEELLNRLGLSVDEADVAIGALALLGAIASAAIPPIRRIAMRSLRRFLALSRYYHRRYRRWFIKQYGQIYNIYLGENERLDLRQAYVPLSFSASENETPSQLMASEVIANREASRILILGDPGSGKTTLLRAFAVGNIKHRRPRGVQLASSRTNHLAIFVSLRHFARLSDISLGEYIVNEIIGKEAGLKSGAAVFFSSLLKKRRCLIMLDGLDEVSSTRYEYVRDRVHIFLSGLESSLPTALAKVVLTCRRQNFLTVQDDWLAAFGGRSYVLAPFRDREVFLYLEKLRGRFIGNKTPESFMSAVVSSNTVDLHRNPLVLAMSAGLYASVPEFEIPSSVHLLYESMVDELLSRQDTRRDPVGNPNRFPKRDKWRFLQTFALATAQREGRFDDFLKAELIDHAKRIAPNLSGVDESSSNDFVQEVINRSGLLSETSDDGTYAFAHRSIHEFLAAGELQRRPLQEQNQLIRKAGDAAWRQTILFVAAAAEESDAFVKALRRRNLELAGYCLAEATVTVETGTDICRALMKSIGNAADELRDAVQESLRDATEGLHLQKADRGRQTPIATTVARAKAAEPKRSKARVAEAKDLFARRLNTRLPALLAATGSPQPAVRSEAIAMVQNIVSVLLFSDDALGADSRKRVRGLLSSDLQATLNVVKALADTGSDEMAALAAEVAEGLPRDPRLVEPLWRLLARPSLGGATRNRLIQLLLNMAMAPDCVSELERQLPYGRDLETNRRRQAYPFRRGHDLRSNLVTLLTYADMSDVTPSDPCLFFVAKTNDRRAFMRLEKDRHRTFRISVRVGSVLRLAAILGPVCALAVLTLTIISSPATLAEPFGFGNLLLVGLPPLLTSVTYSFLKRVSDLELADDDYITKMGCMGASAVLGIYSVAMLPIASASVSSYVLVCTIASYLLYVLPATRLRDRNIEAFFPRINPYLKIYTDPRCKHWVAL